MKPRLRAVDYKVYVKNAVCIIISIVLQILLAFFVFQGNSSSTFVIFCVRATV